MACRPAVPQAEPSRATSNAERHHRRCRHHHRRLAHVESPARALSACFESNQPSHSAGGMPRGGLTLEAEESLVSPGVAGHDAAGDEPSGELGGVDELGEFGCVARARPKGGMACSGRLIGLIFGLLL